MGWGKPFSKKGWATKLFKTAAPIAAAFIPGVGPLAAAAIGAGIGAMGGKSGGGGLKGALLGGLSGGLSGMAAPAIKAGLGSATGVLKSGGGVLNALSGAGKSAFGSAAGAPLAGGIGPTQGSGIAGLLTGGGKAASGLGSAAKLAGRGLGTANTLTSLLSGAQQYSAQGRAEDDLLRGQQEAMGALNPYLESGGAANEALSAKLQSGELGGTFNPGDLTQDPGYQFRLAEGERALGRRQAAAGNYFSGQALKEAQDYGQGIADQTYNDAYNRWLQSQQNTYGMLSDQTRTGLASAGAAGDIYSNIGQVGAAGTMGQSNTISSTLANLLGGGRRQFYDEYGNLVYA